MKIKSSTILFLILGVWLGYGYLGPTDDTDESMFSRSGMRLHTDAKTGLQYLGSSGGGLTPRLDVEGRHMRIDK